MNQKVLSINGVPVAVEVSDTEESRQLGLMHRDYLSDGAGMLFVFPKEASLSFWMKNTRIPLSIAYISKSGEILNIEDMMPYDLASSYSDGMAQYALEVPQGWFERKGICSGDSVVGIAPSSCDTKLIKESDIRNLIRRRLL